LSEAQKLKAIFYLNLHFICDILFVKAFQELIIHPIRVQKSDIEH